MNTPPPPPPEEVEEAAARIAADVSMTPAERTAHMLATIANMGWRVHAPFVLTLLTTIQTQASEIEGLKREVFGRTQEAREVEQIAGAVLGYPWFKDDQKNFPGATEADGVCIGEHVTSTIVEELADKTKALQSALDEALEVIEPFAMAFVMATDGDGTCVTAGEWIAMRNSMSIHDFRRASTLYDRLKGRTGNRG